jgi:hypothetical protein
MEKKSRPPAATSATYRTGSSILLASYLVGTVAFAQTQGDDSGKTPAPTCAEGKNEVSVWVKDEYCPSHPNQASLLANVSRDSLPGHQVALMANIATETVRTQISAGLNYAKQAHTQLGWNVNLARKVTFLQLGGWNIADTVLGSQIGFVNISKRIEGTSLGLLTFSENGLLHLNLSTEESGMGHITFASGHKWYTAFDVGYTVGEANHPYSFGVGLGRHWQVESGYVETEGFIHMVGDRHTTEEQWEHHDKHGNIRDMGLNHLIQAKLRIGKPLFGKPPTADGSVGLGTLGVYAGVSFNALLFGEGGALMGPWTDQLTASNSDSKIWPGIEIGIRLGR